MRNTLYIFFAAVSILIFTFSSCKKDYRIAMDNSIKRYKSGDSKALADIEDNFINLVSKNKFNDNVIVSDSGVIFFQEESKVNIEHPVKTVIKVPEKTRIKNCLLNKKYIIFYDGLKFMVYNIKGGFMKELNPDVDGGKIRSPILYNSKLLYINKLKLRYIDIDSDTGGWITEKKFKTPYDKYYNVKMLSKGTSVFIIIGAGGMYYLNMIEAGSGRIKIDELKISSSKVYINNNKINYITGSAGVWKLINLDTSTGTKTKINNFSSLTDIEMLPEGIIVESGSLLLTYDYNNMKKTIPFKYTLSGKTGDNILLNFKKNIYIVDWLKLHARIESIAAVLPGLVGHSKKSK